MSPASPETGRVQMDNERGILEEKAKEILAEICRNDRQSKRLQHERAGLEQQQEETRQRLEQVIVNKAVLSVVILIFRKMPVMLAARTCDRQVRLRRQTS
ncbi:MAG: hypothetical protein Q9170_002633 [Blastenia crenularia]